VGGGSVANLRLSALGRKLTPPGISVLLGGDPKQAAEQMRRAFPRSHKWQLAAARVGTTTAAAVREAGFEIVPDPSARFPNHARLIHPQGAAGFTDEALATLSGRFLETTED